MNQLGLRPARPLGDLPQRAALLFGQTYFRLDHGQSRLSWLMNLMYMSTELKINSSLNVSPLIYPQSSLPDAYILLQPGYVAPILVPIRGQFIFQQVRFR
jgi:hypothetical protein